MAWWVSRRNPQNFDSLAETTAGQSLDESFIGSMVWELVQATYQQEDWRSDTGCYREKHFKVPYISKRTLRMFVQRMLQTAAHDGLHGSACFLPYC